MLKINNKELGLYGFDLEDEDSIKILKDKGFDIELLTFMAKKDLYIEAVSNYMEDVAKENGYYSVLSFCSYASGNDSYALESQKFISFRSSVWSYCYDELDKIEKGEITIPTLDYFLSTLPKFIKEV